MAAIIQRHSTITPIIQRHSTITPPSVTSSTIPSPTITDNMFNNIENWSGSNDDFDEEVKYLQNYRHQVRDECTLTSLVPEIELFRNMRHFTIEQWDAYNISMGDLEIDSHNNNDDDDGGAGDHPKKRKTLLLVRIIIKLVNTNRQHIIPNF